LDGLSLFLGRVELLENGGHLHGVLLLLAVLGVLGVFSGALRVRVFEPAIQVEALDVAVGHDARYLAVVV
jgi:hypothetical protein